MKFPLEIAEEQIKTQVKPGTLLKAYNVEYDDGEPSYAKYMIVVNSDLDRGRIYFFFTTSQFDKYLNNPWQKPAMLVVSSDEIDFKYKSDKDEFGEETLLKLNKLRDRPLLEFITKYSNEELAIIGTVSDSIRNQIKGNVCTVGRIPPIKQPIVVRGLSTN